jgi:hypothetical protein
MLSSFFAKWKSEVAIIVLGYHPVLAILVFE